MTQPDNRETDDLDLEAPEADVAEQALDVEPSDDDSAPSLGLEVSEWDALEQTRTVPLEDDYR